MLNLQDGGGEDERGWVTQGRMDNIMDNLIAAGKARPMIVVMENNSVLKPGERAPAPPRTPPDPSRPVITVSPTFGEIVTQDLIPTIDGRYRTLADREHRAIAGLSLGAAYALQTGFAHFDKFSHFGPFSGTVLASMDVKNSYGARSATPLSSTRGCACFSSRLEPPRSRGSRRLITRGKNSKRAGSNTCGTNRPARRTSG